MLRWSRGVLGREAASAALNLDLTAMERDFMGIGGKGSEALSKNCSEFSVGSDMKWTMSTNVCSLQEFFPFKTPEEEKPKTVLLDSTTTFQPISAADAFWINQKACFAQAPKTSFGVDGHNVQQLAIHAYNSQGIENYCVSAHLAPISHSSAPIAMRSPFIVYGSSNVPNFALTSVNPPPFGLAMASNTHLVGSVVGAFPSSEVEQPLTTSAQLTIFYRGSVNVYDNVPLDKAKSIMLMASEGWKPTANPVHSVAEAPVQLLTRGSIDGDLSIAQGPKTAYNHVKLSTSGLTNTHSLASDKENQSENGSVRTDDKVGAKSMGTSVSANQNDPPKTKTTSMGVATAANILPRAVPQSRKASLARFLEKRKERVSNTIPYSCDKKHSENSLAPDGAATPAWTSNCSSLVSHSDNQDCSWFTDQSKNCNDEENPLNTKLTI